MKAVKIGIPRDVSLTPQPDVYTVMDGIGSSADDRARKFTGLFVAHYASVLAYAGRRVGADLAQDVVADTFLAAWRNFDELPPQPLPWLYRAAHFAVTNQRRALARRGRLDDRARMLADTGTAPDHSELIVADMQLATAFRSLTEAEREVLRLACWEGLTAADVGEVIGCSPVAAKARLYRARRRLSQEIRAHNSDAESRSPVRGTTIEENAG